MQKLIFPVGAGVFLLAVLSQLASGQWGSKNNHNSGRYGGGSSSSGEQLFNDIVKGVMQGMQQSNGNNNNSGACRSYGCGGNNNSGACRAYGCGGHYPRPPRPTRPDPEYVQPYYPPQRLQYYPPQQPQVVVQPPAPVAPPVQLNIAKVARKPKKNAKITLTKADLARIIGKLDAKSIESARAAADALNGAITDAVSASGNDEAKAAWADVLRNGSRPEDVARFNGMFAGALGGGLGDMLALRGGLAGFLQNLGGGALTPGGQSQAIAGLLAQANALPAGPVQDALLASLNGITVFVELGRLIALTGGGPDSLDVIFVGFQNAGFPPDLLCDLTGMPLMTGPIPDKSHVDAGAIVYIYNPSDNGAPVNYHLGAYPNAMAEGQSQWLNKEYVIRFDSGNGAGEVKYTLTTGTYRWALTEKGWDLQKVKVNVSVDNSEYDGVFNFLVDGDDAILQPGEAADLNSALPIVIEFDYGDGSPAAYKVLTGGKYLVGVDIGQERLDLFDAAAHAELIAARSSGEGSETPGGEALLGEQLPVGVEREAAIQEALTRLKGVK